MINQDLITKDNPCSPRLIGKETSAIKPLCNKISLYNIFWFFFIGSIAGFIIETIWCIINRGSFEWRSSMIVGPFTVVYGIGASILHIVLHNIDKRKVLHIFSFGVATGTAVEYLCSLLQEKLFGSVSWDYSDKFLNINGRVCLQCSIVWGLLAILWVAAIQPLIKKLISKIPAGVYKPLTLCLAVFLLLDALISIAAVTRWGLRLEGIPAANLITTAIDSLLPNETMAMFYPNMIW